MKYFSTVTSNILYFNYFLWHTLITQPSKKKEVMNWMQQQLHVQSMWYKLIIFT